jgi:hypothetical protein
MIEQGYDMDPSLLYQDSNMSDILLETNGRASSSKRTKHINSLTPKCVPAGTKNSRSEGFLLAKHTSHKHPHHDERFFRLAAWFPWMNTPHPQEPLPKGLDEATVKGFSCPKRLARI